MNGNMNNNHYNSSHNRNNNLIYAHHNHCSTTKLISQRFEELVIFELNKDGTKRYIHLSTRALYQYVIQAITNRTSTATTMNGASNSNNNWTPTILEENYSKNNPATNNSNSNCKNANNDAKNCANKGQQHQQGTNTNTNTNHPAATSKTMFVLSQIDQFTASTTGSNVMTTKIDCNNNKNDTNMSYDGGASYSVESLSELPNGDDDDSTNNNNDNNASYSINSTKNNNCIKNGADNYDTNHDSTTNNDDCPYSSMQQQRQQQPQQGNHFLHASIQSISHYDSESTRTIRITNGGGGGNNYIQNTNNNLDDKNNDYPILSKPIQVINLNDTANNNNCNSSPKRRTRTNVNQSNDPNAMNSILSPTSSLQPKLSPKSNYRTNRKGSIGYLGNGNNIGTSSPVLKTQYQVQQSPSPAISSPAISSPASTTISTTAGIDLSPKTKYRTNRKGSIGYCPSPSKRSGGGGNNFVDTNRNNGLHQAPSLLLPSSYLPAGIHQQQQQQLFNASPINHYHGYNLTNCSNNVNNNVPTSPNKRKQQHHQSRRASVGSTGYNGNASFRSRNNNNNSSFRTLNQSFPNIGGSGDTNSIMHNNNITYRERLGSYLHPRDMRRLVTPFSSTNEPEIILRRHVMLLNFDPFRAIVLRDRLLVIVPDGTDSLLVTLEQHVRGTYDKGYGCVGSDADDDDNDNNIMNHRMTSTMHDIYKNAVASTIITKFANNSVDFFNQIHKSNSLRNIFAGGSGNGNGVGGLRAPLPNSKADKETNNNHIAPTMHASAKMVQNMLDDEPSVSTCNFGSTNDLDDNHSSINNGSLNIREKYQSSFKSNRQNNCNAKNANDNHVENENDNNNSIIFVESDDSQNSEHDDDFDPSDFYEETNEWDEIEGLEWIDLPFELQCVDAVMHLVGSTLASDTEVLQNAVSDFLQGLKSTGGLDDDPLSVIRVVKDSTREMSSRVKSFIQSLNRILDDDKLMALMNLSRLLTHPERFIQPVSNEVLDEESDEPELLLEANLQIGLTLLNSLDLIQGKIDAASQMIDQQLDAMRNRILLANMLLSVVSLCVASASLVGSFLGMNLTNFLEDSDSAFSTIVTTTVFGAVLMTISIFMVLVSSGTIPRTVFTGSSRFELKIKSLALYKKT